MNKHKTLLPAQNMRGYSERERGLERDCFCGPFDAFIDFVYHGNQSIV